MFKLIELDKKPVTIGNSRGFIIDKTLLRLEDKHYTIIICECKKKILEG